MEYLKERKYYIDRYDLITIEKCLQALDVHRSAYKELLKSAEGKKLSQGEMAKGSNWLTNQYLYQIKGKRYQQKEKTIEEWMAEDQRMQDKYDTTTLPTEIICLHCNTRMKNTIKHLYILDEPLRMMFLFTCPSCSKRRWIYEDGKEYVSQPLPCPKCKADLNMAPVKETRDKIIWKSSCSSCGFNEKTIDNLKKSRLENEKREEESKKLLDDYRDQFCSEEKGKEAFEYIEALKIAPIIYEEAVRKYDSLAYQKVSQLKKVTILELEKLLSETLEQEKYIKLSMDKPEMHTHIIAPISFQDAASRTKDDSISQASKIIKNLLEGTNWRLMSDGLAYNLGYLSCRLKGYETEKDLLEISGENMEKKQSSKIDYEQRQKYEEHSVVKISQIMGELAGIKNVRKRRLTKDPDGFFLEGTDDFYQCGICGNSMSAAKTWWNLDGVRCADCQRNIKIGIIPSKIHKNRDLYIKGWELTSEYEFALASSTVRKLVRDGLLHGRTLKREDGTIYFTVYLLSENQEFLKKYQRKPRSEWIITDLLGKKINIL